MEKALGAHAPDVAHSREDTGTVCDLKSQCAKTTCAHPFLHSSAWGSNIHKMGHLKKDFRKTQQVPRKVRVFLKSRASC
jgi:hypothetical protein